MPSAGMYPCNLLALQLYTSYKWVFSSPSMHYYSQPAMPHTDAQCVPAALEVKRIPSSAMVPRDTSRAPSLPASAMMACTCIYVHGVRGFDSMGAQHAVHVRQAAAWHWHRRSAGGRCSGGATSSHRAKLRLQNMWHSQGDFAFESISRGGCPPQTGLAGACPARPALGQPASCLG